MTRAHLIGGMLALLLLLFALWWGIPTYRKAKADAMVDEMCAKDGGIKVYERVRLPADRFNKYGNFDVPSINFRKPEDMYYYTSTMDWIVHEGDRPNDLVVWRDHFRIYRSSDGRELGAATYYVRRGGDPISPMHPSSYSCPRDIGIERRVFIPY